MRVDAPDAAASEAGDFLGVDLGIINLAATSDGEFVKQSTGPKHGPGNVVRARYRQMRRKLHKKDPKSAKRLLTKRSGREHRFCRDVNHCISTALLSTAKGTQRRLALEDLNNIGERVGKTVGKRQRRVRHSWAFLQLRAVIAYKAQMAGRGRVHQNPASTSQTWSHCGQCENANRTSPAPFLCVSCGFCAPADLNAAERIRRAALIQPYAAPVAG